MALRFEIIEVRPTVWCVRYPARHSCAYIVETSPGAVVIDAGPETSARGVMMGLQRARVGLSSVRAIVLTDAGCDQSGGATALASRSGAEVLCASRHRRALAVPVRRTVWGRLLGISMREPVNVSRTLAAGQSVEGLEVIEGRPDRGRAIALYSRPEALLFTGTSHASAFCESARWVLPASGHPHEATTSRPS